MVVAKHQYRYCSGWLLNISIDIAVDGCYTLEQIVQWVVATVIIWFDYGGWYIGIDSSTVVATLVYIYTVAGSCKTSVIVYLDDCYTYVYIVP